MALGLEFIHHLQLLMRQHFRLVFRVHLGRDALGDGLAIASDDDEPLDALLAQLIDAGGRLRPGFIRQADPSEQGIKRLIIVTGDRESVAKRVAAQMHTEYKAEVLPHQKLEMVDELKAQGHRVCVVGDGVNDAPALAAGDISIAMGAAGSDVAIHSASIALMNNNLNRIPFLIRLSRMTGSVVRQNLAIGVGFIVIGLIAAAMGDMRERVINVEPQRVITKDNVGVTVDAVIYYRIVDPVKSTFEVQNFAYAATTLAQTNLRNLIGDKQLDETLTARDVINNSLRSVLDEATNPWGVKITRVEVQKIDPPADITEAMSRQMKAEREKRANILESEGIKQSAILEAEGARQAEILKAEGDAQARILRADAEARAIEAISNAAEKFFQERAEVSKRLDVLRDVLAQQTKFIVPSGSDLVNVLGLDDKNIVPLKK
jgi:regulator of protease activity HflC (stomatin/prohibitin superfamily)/soluble P-type ATPase